jgi:allantoin racemase
MIWSSWWSPRSSRSVGINGNDYFTGEKSLTKNTEKEVLRMSKIKVIVPVVTTEWNDETKKMMHGYTEPDTELEVVSIEKGAKSVECTYDAIHGELATVKMAETAEHEGFDGVIIYGFCDPGLWAAKEKLSIPVTGIGEASIHFASVLGNKFTIISAGHESYFPNQIRRVQDILKLYGFMHKCASVRSLKISPQDLGGDKTAEERRVMEEAKQAVEEDGADVIILGCGWMMGVEERIPKELGVPAIIPGVAALKMCESMIRMGLVQSKRCFAFPPEKERIV